MPPNVVERMFLGVWGFPEESTGDAVCLAFVKRNPDNGVGWVHSYISADHRKTFCVYDAPSPEAIRKTAERNELPVGRITQVCVLDHYF